jgi:hypothetical protein
MDEEQHANRQDECGNVNHHHSRNPDENEQDRRGYRGKYR